MPAIITTLSGDLIDQQVPVPKPVTNTPIQTNSHLQSSKPSNAVNWRHWQKGTWTIVIATGLAVLSFILPWKDIGFITINGFRQGTFLLGILFIYPVWASASNRSLNSIAGYACAVVGIVLGIVFYFHCSVQLFDSKNNFAGMGVYTFLGSCVVLAIGVFLYRPVEVALDEQVKNVGVKPLSNGGVFQNPMITAVLGFFVGLLVMFGISSLMAEYGSKTKSGKIDLNFFGSSEKKERDPRLDKLTILGVNFSRSEASSGDKNPKPTVFIYARNETGKAIKWFTIAVTLYAPNRTVPLAETELTFSPQTGLENNEDWHVLRELGFMEKNILPNDMEKLNRSYIQPENDDTGDLRMEYHVQSIRFHDDEYISIDGW